ncbi:MAG: hypothetical protein DMG64_01855, partial [Acidobacteria bacterium]
MRLPHCRVFVASACALLLLCGSIRIVAQVTGGTILGTIIDTSGAVVPKATVTVKNQATDLSRVVSTNQDGLYRAPNLLPGKYEISVSATGFATAVRNDVTVDVGQALQIDLQLRVGHASETVQVTGEQSGVTTTTATISAIVSGTEMRELPLNGRDWASLATLEPGVAPVRTQMPLASGANDRTIRGIGSQLTVGGTRPQQNNYRLDGISINDSSNGAPGSVLGANLGVDAIQEFSVITNNPS